MEVLIKPATQKGKKFQAIVH